MEFYYLSSNMIKKIKNYYENSFKLLGIKAQGEILHEIVSDGLHIDFGHYLPPKNFPYHIFSNVGMSVYPMFHIPYRNVELFIFCQLVHN